MRKKKGAAHANHERWLVSYADFITLLFAFFVVMFSSSQVDKRKAGKLALAMQVAFEKFSLIQTSNLKPPVTSDLTSVDRVQSVEKSIRSDNLKMPLPHTMAPPAAKPQLADMAVLKKDLDAALRIQIERKEVTIRQGREGVVISLREVGFFDSGSSDVRLKSEHSVADIARVLNTTTNFIRIEGHTDNVPIHSPRYSSNWELSSARATEMIALFIDRYGISPRRLAVGAYAEFHPVASNDTAEGRAENRRVDIIVLNSVER